MPALPYPTYGIAELYLFPVYQTREAYRQATGVEAPPYDPTLPTKSWCDPSAAQSTRRKVIYENVIAYAENGAPFAGPDGKPMLEPLMIDKDFAAVVNIPVKDFTGKIQEQPVSDNEIPVPMRALDPEEELYFAFGGTVAVRNKKLFQSTQVGFLETDRVLLRSIAEKLGVAL